MNPYRILGTREKYKTCDFVVAGVRCGMVSEKEAMSWWHNKDFCWCEYHANIFIHTAKIDSDEYKVIIK
jgi:hypothetical protein